MEKRKLMDRHPPSHTLKIAYVLDSFPVLSQTFVLQEILELQRQGLSLHVFSLFKPQTSEMARGTWSGQIAVTYVSLCSSLNLLAMLGRRFFKTPGRFLLIALLTLAFHRPRAALSYLCYGAFIAEQIEHQGIDHLHAHFAMGATSVAQIVYLLIGTPYSFTTHAYDIYLSRKSTIAYKMRTASFVVTCSVYNQQYLQELVDDNTGKRIHCVYVGLSLNLFPDRKVNPPSDTPLILAVCRLIEKKGLLYLLEACRILKDRGYSFNCRIVGTGPQQPLLEQKIHELALADSVELAGAAAHDEVIALYQQATIVTLPCIIASDGDRDGIPNVLMEALYMKVPVVSTPVSGIPELISEGQNGLLVPPQDSSALATALARLLDDPVLYARLANAGRETVVERFDVAKNVVSIIEFFTEADVDKIA